MSVRTDISVDVFLVVYIDILRLLFVYDADCITEELIADES